MQEGLTNRVTIIDRGGEIEVHIATRKMWWPLAFLPFWWAGWTAGGIIAFVSLAVGEAGEAAAFLVVWLAFWFFAWLFVAVAWLWLAFGKEIVRIVSGQLTLRYDVLGRGRGRSFDANAISGLRAVGLFGNSFNPFSWSGSLVYWGIGGGVIAFDNGSETVRFGGQLEEKEAKTIVERLARYLPDRALAS